jgi:hypothetical protein
VVAVEHARAVASILSGVDDHVKAFVAGTLALDLVVVVDCAATSEPVALVTRATHVVVQRSERTEVQVGGVAIRIHVNPALFVWRRVTRCWGDVVAMTQCELDVHERTVVDPAAQCRVRGGDHVAPAFEVLDRRATALAP